MLSQLLTVIKSQEHEKYAFLSQGTGVLLNFAASLKNTTFQNRGILKCFYLKRKLWQFKLSHVFHEFIQIHSLFPPKAASQASFFHYSFFVHSQLGKLIATPVKFGNLEILTTKRSGSILNDNIPLNARAFQ